MELAEPIKVEIMDLTILSLEGQVTREQYQRLIDLLQIEPAARAYYFQVLAISESVRKLDWDTELLRLSEGDLEKSGDYWKFWQKMLEREQTARALTIPRPSESDPKESRSAIVDIPEKAGPYRGNNGILAAAVIGLALVSMLLIYDRFTASTGTSAVITRSLQAVWGETRKSLHAGDPLPAERLTLREGLAEIQFENGAEVVLEGPAEIRVLSDSRMYLYHGKLTAKVGHEALGFVIDTPSGKVLDLGTEFGVGVDLEERTQVHVFRGEVMVYPMDSKSNYRLEPGKARSISRDGTTAEVDYDPVTFIREKELTVQLAARQGDDRARWRAFVYDQHRDKSLVGHYFDEQDIKRPAMLLNSVYGEGVSQPGVFGTEGRNKPGWVQGRWPGEMAVRLERDKHQSIVIPAQEPLSLHGPITIAAWIYYPNEKQMGGHLISCRQDNDVNYQYSIFDSHYSVSEQQNRFEFLRYEDDVQNRSYSKVFYQQPNTWYYFCATHDNETLKFYVNGELFDLSSYASQVAPLTAEIVIGSMKREGRYVMTQGDFDGIIDDLMLFDRCLTDVEIKAFYEAGKPISGD